MGSLGQETLEHNPAEVSRGNWLLWEAANGWRIPERQAIPCNRRALAETSLIMGHLVWEVGGVGKTS